MSSSELRKNLKVTPEAHQRLREATLARYGTDSVTWSHVIETLCEEEVKRQRGDDE